MIDENTRPTQADQVLFYMRFRGPITALTAMQELGIMRLAARIHELRKRGHTIDTQLISVPSGDGHTNITEYRLNLS